MLLIGACSSTDSIMASEETLDSAPEQASDQRMGSATTISSGEVAVPEDILKPSASSADFTPANYRIVDNPRAVLETVAAEAAYYDWWDAHSNHLSDFWQDPPQDLFARADLNNSDRNGTYALARNAGQFLGSVTEIVRTTGDRNALDELLKWTDAAKLNLKDHDGRGYVYYEYSARGKGDAVDGKHNMDDTNWLDEQMMAANISHWAWVLHQNRDVDPKYAEAADFWFSYLDTNLVPKWLYRSTYGTDNQYTPPASLGLQNAVNWDGGIGVDGNGSNNAPDIARWAGPEYVDGNTGQKRFNQFDDISHQYPAHHFGHPYLMSIYQYEVMGRYFQEVGAKPVSAIDSGTYQDFLDASERRQLWWDKTITRNSDGSIDFWLNQYTSSGGLRSDAYAQYVAMYLNNLHWLGVGKFADDNEMAAYANAWYNGPSNSAKNVFEADNISTMTHKTDGSGGQIAFRMSSAGLMGCWDETGVIQDLNAKAIIDPSSHHILANQDNMSTAWYDGNHYTNILSCEQS